MAKFRARGNFVEAVQLLWSTWSEMCVFADVGKFRDGAPEGCFVDASGKVTEDCNGRIGLKIPGRSPTGMHAAWLAAEGDWIVKDGSSYLEVYSPAAFEAMFEPVIAPPESMQFKPNWEKYPKLAAAFVHRPAVNIYWEELRALLADARADAVRFVHDVRADELTKAHAEGRAAERAGKPE